MNHTNLLEILALDILLMSLGILIWILMRKFFGGYSDQKGKNVATKEDIEDITRLVEGVSKDFRHETEQLKSSLQVSAETKSSTNIKCQQAAENFYACYMRYCNFMKIVPSSDERKDLDKAKATLAQLDIDLNNAFCIFELYVDDIELIKSALELMTWTHSNYQLKWHNCYYDLMKITLELESSKSSGNFENQKSHLKKIQEINVNFLEYTTSITKNTVIEQKKFLGTLKKYLLSLSLASPTN
ncbi:MAG: hypothetical protein K6L73_12055 [Cellvibrionaceae bacterium]